MLPTFFLFDRRLITRFDLSLFFIALLIVGFGIFNLYSASISVHAVGAFYKKQVYWLCLGIVLLFLGSFLNYSYLEQFGYFFYFFVIFLLVLVLFQGKFISGSRRWLSLGLFNIQPSEFIKLSLIIVLAKWFKDKFDTRGFSLSSLFIPGCFLITPFFLIFLQPDLGSALLLVLIFFSLVFFVRVRFRTLFILLFCAFLFFPSRGTTY
jgi:Bacterial cell division membrane protein